MLATAHAAPPAFPGAEGWGRNARGGGQNVNAKVLAVASLADSGPGTLREALKTRGPRIVVFRTGGVIELTNRLTVQDDFLTIAAQTAPGDGVIVRGHGIRIGASHVIVRGLRIRNGDGPGPKGELRDSIQIGRTEGKPVHDIIIDHCSFGWSVDETAEFWYGARNVTLSYNIFSEALWKSIHPKGKPRLRDPLRQRRERADHAAPQPLRPQRAAEPVDQGQREDRDDQQRGLQLWHRGHRAVERSEAQAHPGERHWQFL